MLRASRFPILEDLVRISSPPSPMVATYRRMWSYGAHFRCDNPESSSHVTYDSGIGVTDSECVSGSIDVGVLNKIYLVAFGCMSIIVMKVSWIQHVNQGRRTIRKDRGGFWTCQYNSREDSTRRNPFLLPANAAQVLFVEDSQNPQCRVVIFHEPRSRRVVCRDAHEQLDVNDEEMDLETPIPTVLESSIMERGLPQEVPLEQVQLIDADIEMAVDDAVFDDTQYEEEMEMET